MIHPNVFPMLLIKSSTTENTETSGSHGLWDLDISPGRVLRLFPCPPWFSVSCTMQNTATTTRAPAASRVPLQAAQRQFAAGVGPRRQ